MMTMTDHGLGLYIHVPFCLKKCHYCDFYSAPATSAVRNAYLAALKAHLVAKAQETTGHVVDTVYFGGGTPSLLHAEEITSVLDTVRHYYHVLDTAEITVECNPATFQDGFFEALKTAGVNRVSIGLQSANERELCLLGRPHGFGEFLTTVLAARAVGIENISVDVMFGIPEQTSETLAHTLDAVLSVAPTHISAYGLRVEEGTPFFAMRDQLKLPDDDTVADMQLQIAARLAAAGYSHYEISNYARDGYRSRHNMRYWLGEDYLGFGAAAHSYFSGVRYAAPADTDAYVAAITRGDLAAVECDRTLIESREAREEYVMLRMRLFEGLDEAEFSSRFGIAFEEAYGDISRLVAGGFLVREGGRIAFTEKGMYVSNAILSEWLDFGEENKE